MSTKPHFDPATLRPGDIFAHNWGNDQSYGVCVPVRTSRGWDLIDTYQIDHVCMRGGETADEASIRRVIELAKTEHDHYVRRRTYEFYHHNGLTDITGPRRDFTLICNLTEMRVVGDREAEDYDPEDVVRHVPLYNEQHFSWSLGRTMGLTLVRRDAKPSDHRCLSALISDAYEPKTPYTTRARNILHDDIGPLAEKMRTEGRLTPREELKLEILKRRLEALHTCEVTCTKLNNEYYERLAAIELTEDDVD